MIIDVFSLTDEEANELLDALHRRQVLKEAEQKVEVIIEEFLEARDGPAPDPTTATVEDYPEYVQPTGAHNAYLMGRIIRQGTSLYRPRRNGVAHSPEDAPEEWEEVFLVDGEITTTRPVDPDTGIPDYPVYDSSKTYYQNTHNTPLVIVKHNGTLYELIHSAAAPGYTPGAAGMHAVWRVYTS